MSTRDQIARCMVCERLFPLADQKRLWFHKGQWICSRQCRRTLDGGKRGKAKKAK